MSFGGGFGGGFGQQNKPTAFGGGFGSTPANNTGSVFGSGATNNTGFGANNNTGGGMFGGGGTSSGFGGNTGNSTGFGGFGAKPATTAFGSPAATTGSNMFGSGATTGTTGAFGGGFGSSAAPTSGFGTTNTGGGLFGNKPGGFGSTTTTNTPSAFGGGSGFGSTAGTGFGAAASSTQCEGTQAVPFTAFVEKEPNSSMQNAYQSISFQQPYKNFSPEELRLADYSKGLRYNQNQGGAFGTNTNFGGFGSSNQATTGGFGSANNATTGSTIFGGGATGTGFGTSQPASTGFGSNTATTGGGLFGAAKPATGGLFGAQPQAQTGGGLFGSTTNSATTGGFGSTNTGFGSANTGTGGGGLFGNNSATAAKPAFSFGNTQPAATTGGFGSSGTGFGTANTNTGGGLFGNTQQQSTTTGFGGAAQQQPASTNAFGGGFGSNNTNTGGGLFGNTQQKPATTGLFGAQPAASNAGGLFGSQPAATNNSPFGGANNTNTGSSLFGAKPATAGGLFGQPAAQTNTGTNSLFGGGFGAANQNNQPQQSTGLFGASLGNNSNQQKPGGLFGQPQQQGSSLFGNSGTQQQSNLFGSSTIGQQQQQQQPAQSQGSIFGTGSIFTQSQQGGTPQSFSTSLTDPGAYGTRSMFAENNSQENLKNPGPLATPLSSANRQKKTAALPLYKLNASGSSRFNTPSKSLRGGFGLSYTPGSVSTAGSTPSMFSSSLLSGSRALSKSMSTNSLRRSFHGDDSILAPGAFTSSTSTKYGTNGSFKKLIINRNIRSDLFKNPVTPDHPVESPNKSIIKKQVTFETPTPSPSATINGNVNGTTDFDVNGTGNPNGTSPTAPLQSVTNNSVKTPSVTSPEMTEVNKNKQLTIVNENGAKSPKSPPNLPTGAYWMTPTREEIEKMTRQERQRVSGFTVGREGVGQIDFDTRVNLDGINLDDIFNKIVILEPRRAEVYPDDPSIQKPQAGHGLNVPSTITLFNSWPRNASKRGSDDIRLKKHIKKLQTVEDTEFVSYDADNGTWVFKVPHYTVYGLDYDDEEDDEEDDMEVEEDEGDFGNSTLTAPPDTPTPQSRTPKANPQYFNQSFASDMDFTQTESDPEDTFEFRKRKVLPGAFDDEEVYSEEEVDNSFVQDQESFLDNRSVGSQSENGVEEAIDQDDVYEDDESVSIVDQEMAGSYPETGNTAERMNDSQDEDDTMEFGTPGAIVKARARAQKLDTPSKLRFPAANDWAATLRATASPKKQDRAVLKSLIDVHGDEKQSALARTEVPTTNENFSKSYGFASVMDVHNDLFGKVTSPIKVSNYKRGDNFEKPFNKKSKIGDDESEMPEEDRAFHDSVKPSWGPDGTLVYAASAGSKPFTKSRRAREKDGLLTIQKSGIAEASNVRFAKFSNESSADALKKHQSLTVIEDSEGVPYATLPDSFSFLDFFDEQNARDPSVVHEKLVWELASILFDAIEVPQELNHIENAVERLRKDKLSVFWQKLVVQASAQHVAMARSNEEKAIASLSGHNIPEACGHLINGKDFHLATLIAMIGGKESLKRDIREQLSQWRTTKALSEFSQPVRALYELLAGNVCVCDGNKAPHMEDRIESFIISKRFGLDWRQAFGMRLWYAIKVNEEFDSAVKIFDEEMTQDKETSRPLAWYVEQKIPKLWQDDQLNEREDLLWGLLKLYTYDDADLEAILRPENSQLSPLDMRLSWQLSRALTSFGALDYQEAAEEKKDQTTLAFASQLNNEGHWLDAVFVLLHLSSTNARAKSIQDHLARHAGKIGSEDSQSFVTLTQNYKIPASWIWEAKALYTRSVRKDPLSEVECLTKAGMFEEAHRTFAKEVAPKALIEFDYATLRNILASFEGKENSISEWHLGGEIYQDFLTLVECQKKNQELDFAVLERLLVGLPAVVEESRHPAFMETVAIETISGVVAKAVVDMEKKGENVDLPKVLRLPLTEDRYLKHTIDLSLGYYRSVMAGGR
ncbi:hypothetical protein sscle_03g027890 [Sclerotinia sclerotiorum 1980 UF-70]|uniref:Peptidase S59 domain-containing protein n=1 Tax=Sclerotinia sclerotiorum (strain ATCC 18683 / 1980 / Ss-1) TaxID=665079 RepID=A0A1D9PZJ5_SCLS1|nr:hypothetical protein sscle_03g027890 [Sclerotinia sclerotiorum 1980 UF-70]